MSATPYTLIDGEQRHAEFPETFRIPLTRKRESLDAGDIVKLGFQFASVMQGERMWVLVASRQPDGDYIGHLDNDPVLSESLCCGDAVQFSPRHVLAIWQD